LCRSTKLSENPDICKSFQTNVCQGLAFITNN
jgi:hypothetical protein